MQDVNWCEMKLSGDQCPSWEDKSTWNFKTVFSAGSISQRTRPTLEEITLRAAKFDSIVGDELCTAHLEKSRIFTAGDALQAALLRFLSGAAVGWRRVESRRIQLKRVSVSFFLFRVTSLSLWGLDLLDKNSWTEITWGSNNWKNERCKKSSQY